jgi:nucleoside-diphosphate kinase
MFGVTKMERTLLVIKPDAFLRGGEICDDVEKAGLQLGERTWGSHGINHWKRHYKEHEGKPFFEDLCSEMANKDVSAIVITGENAVARLRQLTGATDPLRAASGTLRRKYGTSVRQNAVHASDSVESANREIELWFDSDEMST